MKFTIKQFRKEYPNDDVCLDMLFNLRYSSQPCCPQCSQETTFKRIPNRRSYQCSDPHCQHQLYPTAGTVFEKTRTPLVDWFYAIYLMTSTRNGVSAKELERQLGVTYKTAFRMGHQIRKLMDNKVSNPLEGIVEVDETYIGGKSQFKHKSKKNKTTGYVGKVPVFGILQRGGSVIVKVLEDDKAPYSVLQPIIKKNVDSEATVITDSAGAYSRLHKEYNHEIVNHVSDEYVRGNLHTNTIEGLWSHLKRTIKGTHIQVSRKYLQAYADECAFRYTYRKQGQLMFYTILNQISWEKLQPFEEQIKSPLDELDFLLKP